MAERSLASTRALIYWSSVVVLSLIILALALCIYSHALKAFHISSMLIVSLSLRNSSARFQQVQGQNFAYPNCPTRGVSAKEPELRPSGLQKGIYRVHEQFVKT